MLLGAAMLGAVAGGVFPDLASAMPAMSRVLTTHHPDPDSQRLHAARHRAFLTLQATARDLRGDIDAALRGDHDALHG